MENSTPSESPIDRYVVLEYLAEGGMGAIYLGKKMGAGGFEKQVVLKQLLPEFTRQPEFIDLFLREARLSATLDHANIIHTIDLVTAGEDYFIVMEYLDGADLRTLLRRCKKKRRRLSPAAGIYVARELLSALAYAHNKVGPDGVPLRLIHRDISPSNILISGSGEVKLTDFGIAKASTHNSVFYRVKGKVGYMSPEQAKSEPLDARSDLYSLAVCLYEMMTGERLFVNVGLTTSADEMYSQPVPLLSHKVPGLPPELDKVMLKALSRDPDHRYQTAGEFQEALLRCAHRHGLMMSAPDLSEHLRAVCGDQRSWRVESGEHTGAAGTELYEMDEDEGSGSRSLVGGGTDQIDDDDDFGDSSLDDLLDSDSGLSMAVAASGQLLHDRDRRRRRARTSITKLTELRGMALTSMINLAGTSPDHAGASPLIDFNDLAQSPMLPSTTGSGASPHPGPAAAAPASRGSGSGRYPPGSESYSMGGYAQPHSHSAPHMLPHPNPALQPQVQSQVPLGSLADLDPLEQTGIVVDPGSSGARPPQPMYRDPDRITPVGPPYGFAQSGAPAAMSGAGVPVARPPGRMLSMMEPVRRPLLLLLVILLLGVATAAAIGMSGPTVQAETVPRSPAASPTSSPPAAPPTSSPPAASPTSSPPATAPASSGAGAGAL